MKNKKSVTIIIIFTLLVLSFIIWYSFSSSYSISDRTDKVKKEINKDEYPVLGWVRVQGTNIDYPVVYGQSAGFDVNSADPDFSFAWRNYHESNEHNRIVLYGHNIRNVSSQPLINEKRFNNFENLPSFLYYSFVEDNKYIQYSNEKENKLYKIYAVYLQEGEENTGLEEMTKKQKKEYIDSGLKKSYFKFDIDVNSDDNLLTLTTCTRFYDTTTYSLVVDARMVRKDEKIKNYKVTKNDSTYKNIEKLLKGDDNNDEKA